MGLLDGKVALITGAGGGLGEAYAKLFAREGAAVVVNDLGGPRDGSGADRSMAQQVVDAIKAEGGRAVANGADISTMEGGMVTTDDRELYELVRSLRAHGWTRDLPAGSSIFEKRDDDFYEAYRFILPGYNVRPIEMSGAIGIEQLKKLPAMTAARRRNWALFQELFAGDNRFIIQRENGKSSAFSFTLILNPEADLSRPRIMRALKEADIGYRIITGGCITRHDVIKYYDHKCVDGLPNANLAHDHGFFVGNHPIELRPQIERLREVLDRAAR